MSNPLFTILTSTYNAGHAINIAAASVRVQRRSDVEYIIIDGASTDDTLEHARRNGDVVSRIISEPDTGIYDALNKGIAAASGELIGIIGADDSYSSGALDIVARYHRESPADIYAGQTLLTTDGRGTLRLDEEFGPGALASGIPFGHNAMFATRGAYEKVGLYDLGYRIAADAQWVHRAIRAGLTCTRIPRLLVQFSSAGVSTVDTKGILDESGRAIKENFPFLDEKEALALLYGVRGWSDTGELVAILRKHPNPELRVSLKEAFRGKPAVWASIERDVGGTASVRSVVAQPKPRPAAPDHVVIPRCAHPVFSFVIPAYNVESYISKCLDSILGQPFKDIEVIVVDDGSKDATAAVVENYRSRDQRITLIRQANAGQGAARGVALEHAAGKYIWCVDSDDRIQERVLDRILGIFANTDAEVVVLNYAYENEDGSLEYSTLVPNWLAGQTVNPTVDERTFGAVSSWSCPPWRYVIRNDFLKRHRIKFHAGLFYEDHPLAIDVMSAATRIHVDSTVSYYYLRRAGSTVRSADRRVFDFLPIRRLVLDRLASTGLLQRFPSITTSYVFPINFVKAHVGADHRVEFLERLCSDITAQELDIVRAAGASGELALVSAHQNGLLGTVDLDRIESASDRASGPLEVSRTLAPTDVEGLSFPEGPYPDMGLPGAFRWVSGRSLKLRTSTTGLSNPTLVLRYRNIQAEQLLVVEQSGGWIEMFPCRTVDVAEPAMVTVALMPNQASLSVNIGLRKSDGSDRDLSILVERLDVIEGSDEAALLALDRKYAESSPPTVVKGVGSNTDGMHVDVRRDPQPRTYVRIGKESHIGGTFVFERGKGFVSIGDRSSIGGGCLLVCSQDEGITIGSNVMLSWNVTVIDTNAHSLDPEIRANDAFDWLVGVQVGRQGHYKDWTNVLSAPIVIKDGAWIGFGSSILKGVTIGAGAVIGSNSVVTKDIPDGAIAAGNPARIVGQVPRRGDASVDAWSDQKVKQLADSSLGNLP